MKLSATARKRRQRDRAKRGAGVIQRLEISDREAWCGRLLSIGLLEELTASDEQLKAATSRFVDIHCESYRRNQTLELLGADGPDDRPEVEPSIYEELSAGARVVEMSDIELDKM